MKEEKKDGIFEELYFYWLKEHSVIDTVCDELEQLFADEWKEKEGEAIDVLSQIQEKVFWEGAITVNKWKKQLKNLKAGDVE